MIRMVQTSADSIRSHFDNMVSTWPSLDHIPEFDYAMIDACVGCDDYRKNLLLYSGLGDDFKDSRAECQEDYKNC